MILLAGAAVALAAAALGRHALRQHARAVAHRPAPHPFTNPRAPRYPKETSRP